jgi:wyosine [tRNA(Phe)-imidazoG37] synthetase (radical SAM superfamily)
MQYVFGPVPSRRLGKSLGIDTIPLKTCNWNCVYCQLGRTKPLENQRKSYFPPSDILAEVKETLAEYKNGGLDWVTFVGSGEPTLHEGIGWLIREVKSATSLPVAVITNGSLLYLPEVRQELSAADAILPTLDAGSSQLYLKINRPHPEFSFERLVEGLIDFHDMYMGKLWVEVMLIKDLNDSESALFDLARVLGEISPDKIHITLPTRPPAEVWVEPSDEEGLMRARAMLGEAAEVTHPAEGTFTLTRHDDVNGAILSIIKRHPMRKEDLERIFHLEGSWEITNTLAELQAEGLVQVVKRLGVSFWSASPSYFPDEVHSRKTKPR